LRAGGAGIPGFYTKTAVGTVIQTGGFPIKYKQGEKFVPEIVSEPKETRTFTVNGDEAEYVLEESITGDVAIVNLSESRSKLGKPTNLETVSSKAPRRTSTLNAPKQADIRSWRLKNLSK
jgi:Coenzyme A transferase